MKTTAQYEFVVWADGVHIIEQGVEYGVAYESMDEAERALRYILWLEETYSKPRAL
jgi:hypothetical protein